MTQSSIQDFDHQLTMAFQQRARVEARTATGSKRLQHATKSAQSLIGDIWVRCMIDGRFDRPETVAEHAPLVVLLNEQVPLPNQHTALAWNLICEGGAGFARPSAQIRFILPQSINPAFYTEQSNLIDEAFSASPALPTVASLRVHHTTRWTAALEKRRQFYRENSYHSPHLLVVNAGKAVQVIRPVWHTDSRAMNRSELDTAYLSRLAMMQDWMTYCAIPTHWLALSAQMGASLRQLSRHGLWVKGAPLTQWTPTGDDVKVASSRGAMTINAVPRGTPPIWLGFNESEAVSRWIEAYIRHRPTALEQFENPFASGSDIPIQNQAWEGLLAESGLLKRPDQPKASKPTAREVSGRELDAMLSAINF